MNASSDVAPDGATDGETKTRQPRKARFQRQAENYYATIGAIVGMFNPIDGAIIASCAEERALELHRVAESHPKFKRACESLMNGSDISALIVGHVGMLAAIGVNHGVMPQAIVGGAAGAVRSVFTRLTPRPRPRPMAPITPLYPQGPNGTTDEPPTSNDADAFWVPAGQILPNGQMSIGQLVPFEVLNGHAGTDAPVLAE